MLLERDLPRPRGARRTPAQRIVTAIRTLTGEQGEITLHRETPWASITFSGARHTMSISFLGDDAVAAGEEFIAALPDHEFAIPGFLVADACVTDAEHRLLPSPRLVVLIEILVLEES